MRKTDEEWQSLFAKQRSSGLTVKDFCKENHISVQHYYTMKKKISTNDENNAFVPVSIENNDESISFTVNGFSITCKRDDLHLILEAIL